MKSPFRAVTLLVCIMFHEHTHAQDQLKLWYNQPATTWNEALPIGNGRLAAMVFGSPQKERLQLNEETVWAGEPGNNMPSTGFAEALPQIQNLIFANPFFAIPAVKTPLVSGSASIQILPEKEVYEYDLQTMKGNTYTLIFAD
ncbi:MAG TPA: glycoside hydrolase N-terminal domain-containing protein [Ohtaekwangia sp.]